MLYPIAFVITSIVAGSVGFCFGAYWAALKMLDRLDEKDELIETLQRALRAGS